MKKKSKKKNQHKSRKPKKKKTYKLRKKSRRSKTKKQIIKFKKQRKAKPGRKIRISQKIRRRKITKKRKIKIPKFKEQKKHLIKLSFQKIINFMLEPFFRAYDDFREKRKIEKLRKIVLEKREKERQIKEERRLRYEAKQQELRDEIKLAKVREQDLKKFIRQEQAILTKEQAENEDVFMKKLNWRKKLSLLEKENFKKLRI